MFQEGTIVYFDPFYFSNGKSSPKPKYCIILKNIENETIIASLPTSVDNVPNGKTKKGCIDIDSINFNAYVFPSNEIITDCGKSFNLDTFIYGYQIDTYSAHLWSEIYPLEGIDYNIFGVLTDNYFKELIDCLKNSKVTKKKYTRIL